MSVLHQDSGGIGKSIPSALEISLGNGFCTPRPPGNPEGLGVQNPWPREILGVGDGFSNPSLLLVEHGYNLNLFLFPFNNIALLFEANVTLRDCRYSHTQSSGGTFPMLLATMKASDWKGSLDFSTREVLNTNWNGMEKVKFLGRGAKRDGGSDLALQSCQRG